MTLDEEGHLFAQMDLKLEEKEPPATLFYGTVADFIDDLKRDSSNQLAYAVARTWTRNTRPCVVKYDRQAFNGTEISPYHKTCSETPSGLFFRRHSGLRLPIYDSMRSPRVIT